MKTFIFAYIGGLLASIPAFIMFNKVGASPFQNFDALYSQISNSLVSIVTYFALLWVVPAFGSTIGAKLGGHYGDFQHMYGRGIGGQFIFSIIFSIMIMTVASLGKSVMGMSTTEQMLVFLMASQVGCTLGTVWGY